MQAGALLSVDRPVPAPSLGNSGDPGKPRRMRPSVDAQRREPARGLPRALSPRRRLTPRKSSGSRPGRRSVNSASPCRPKTPMPQDWRETLLYRPIATSSATFESMGRKVVISGAQDIDVDQTCSFRDDAWPCGQRARAAFNAWLRGRALNCFVPPDVERFAIAAPCRLGKQDVGAWLVANGWAMALPSGIYGKAEAICQECRRWVSSGRRDRLAGTARLSKSRMVEGRSRPMDHSPIHQIVRFVETEITAGRPYTSRSDRRLANDETNGDHLCPSPGSASRG